MDAQSQSRIDKLVEKYAQKIELPEDIGKGFLEAWAKPGFGPISAYIRAASAAGRMGDLVAWAAAAGRMGALVAWAATAGRMGDLVAWADDAQKLLICDALGIN